MNKKIYCGAWETDPKIYINMQNPRIIKKFLNINKVGKWVVVLRETALSDVKAYYKNVGNKTANFATNKIQVV